MSIRNRLRISHMAMVIIPIILSIIMTIIIGRFYLSNLETAYNIKFNKKATFEQLVDRKGTPLFVNVRFISREKPELYEDISYLKGLDNDLAKTHSGIVEDESSIAELERDYLQINGFEVTIETRGDLGLRRALQDNREKIESTSSEPQYIETIWGSGYRFKG